MLAYTARAEKGGGAKILYIIIVSLYSFCQDGKGSAMPDYARDVIKIAELSLYTVFVAVSVSVQAAPLVDLW